jgi:GntR family transcriptional regulator, histidine utilization repressor
MTLQEKPRYQQLKEDIIAQISSGRLRPRDRVPSENELVGSAGVSRMTANRALRELTHEGYVERIAGVGTFVSDLRAASHVLEVRNIADEIAHRGHRHSATWLAKEALSADAGVAGALQVEEGEPVFHLMVVHRENGAPIQQEDRYVIASFAPHCLQQDFSCITPSAYLCTISPLQEAEQVVQAVMPDAAVRVNLQMEPGEPCLLVKRMTWAGGRPVSFARLHHPGNRFELAGRYAPLGFSARNRDPALRIHKVERQ